MPTTAGDSFGGSGTKTRSRDLHGGFGSRPRSYASVPPLNPLHLTIAKALSELGMSGQPCRNTTLLIQEGYCLGRRFVFGGVQAVWLIAENVIHFHDDNGRTLKSVVVGAVARRKAA